MHRLRIIAGPNGSGKTTLTNELINNYHLNFGYYLNADELENTLKFHNKISLSAFDLTVNEISFRSFYESHILKSKSNIEFKVSRNSIYLLNNLPTRTYFPTLLADFIRQELMKKKKTFSFETVMSGSDKIELLRYAKEKGYRIYLYFICIEKDAQGKPSVNLDRIKDRVEKNGHNVSKSKVISRYEKTLANLINAIKLVDHAYLFDNSSEIYKLVAEVSNGEINFDPNIIPEWFEESVLKKL